MWLDRSKFQTTENGRFPFSVSLLSWAYNEEQYIVEFLERAQKFMDSVGVEYEHILIDDCSRDRTHELALECQKTYPQLKIIRNPQNLNSGWNTRIAIQNASKDILLWQMVDWSYDISRLREYLWYFKEYDVIQGVRKRSNLQDRSDNFTKAFISISNYLLIRTLFGVPLLDFQNVTIYPTALAKSISCESTSAFVNPELIMKAYWSGAGIIQIPVAFFPRVKGEAKGTKFRFLTRSVKQVLFYWFRWKILRKIKFPAKSQLKVPAISEGLTGSNPVAIQQPLCDS